MNPNVNQLKFQNTFIFENGCLRFFPRPIGNINDPIDTIFAMDIENAIINECMFNWTDSAVSFNRRRGGRNQDHHIFMMVNVKNSPIR